MTRRRSQIRGFTLIEVLAALVLIGVVLPVAMRGITLSIQVANQAKHRSEAIELARHQLDTLALGPDTTGYTGAGDFADSPGYRWESRTAERDYGVNELTVEVFWKNGGVEQSVVLTTLTYPNGLAAPATTDSTTSTSGGTTS